MNKGLFISTLVLFLFTSCQKELTIDSTPQLQGLSISGKIDCPKGGMTLTPDEYLITLTDKNNVEKSTVPSSNGTYFFDNLEVGNSYRIKAVRKSYPNTITFSSVGVEKHLRNTTQKENLALIAADVNEDGEVDGTDLLQLNNFIAKRTNGLPRGQWLIVSASVRLANQSEPFNGNDPLKNLQTDAKNVDFIVLKKGDIDLENCQ